MEMILPNNYVETEMMCLDEGSITIGAIASACTITGSIYGGDTAVSLRYYLSNKKATNKRYNFEKWGISSTAVFLLGIVAGGIFMVGFEKKLCSYFYNV